jgi:hypothetical protein
MALFCCKKRGIDGMKKLQAAGDDCIEPLDKGPGRLSNCFGFDVRGLW